MKKQLRKFEDHERNIREEIFIPWMRLKRDSIENNIN